MSFEDFNYDGKYDKKISELLGEDFDKTHEDYELFAFIYFIAFEMKDPVWSAFRDNEAVVTPDGELNVYWSVCADYMRNINRLFDAILEKHKDNHAMICCVAEVYEEYRYDSLDVPYSKICANLPGEIGINIFNLPKIRIGKVCKKGGYFQYKVASIFDKNICKTALGGVVYVNNIFKEYILCSAIWYKELKVFILGARHHNCLQYMGVRGLKEYGVFENDETVLGGFWTSHGRFIHRGDEEEMAKLLENHNFVKRTSDKGYYSEDFLINL